MAEKRGDVPPHAVGYQAVAGLGAEFEADLRCALTSSCPVLITAQADMAVSIGALIHHAGVNADGSCRTVDCRLLHSREQFEHAFDSVQQGTVVLRDIDRLASALQTPLFLAMARRRVRVIATTSASLFEAAAEGVFDEALFYRLNQIHLVVPDP